MSLTLASIVRHPARLAPQSVAIRDGARAVTYDELDRRARAAAALMRGLGIERGDRVMQVLPNRVEWFVGYYGALQAGAIPVPLNPLLAGPELAAIMADCEPRAVLVDGASRVAGREAAARAGIGCRVIDVDAGDLPGEPEPSFEPTLDLRPDDTAVMLYTSGTTGRPKGVELTHAGILWNAQVFAYQLLSLGPEDRCLCVMPLSHAYGYTCIHAAFLYVGASITLLPRFEPEAVFRAIYRDRITVFMGVPAMYWALLNARTPEGGDVSSLRACVSGGQALPAEVHRRFEERFGVLISEGYGLTEASPSVHNNRFSGPRKLRSAGLPHWGVEVRIVDDQGRPCPVGVDGEILVGSPGLMKGYYRNPEATAQAIRDGWLVTGDIGHLDEDGFLFIIDRKKEMIITGGYNVYPREIEEVLYAHPDVLEASAIGVPDERLGELVVAYVVPREGRGIDAEPLRAHCVERLARYKVPREIRVMATLPKGTTGKIDRRRLREIAVGKDDAPCSAPVGEALQERNECLGGEGDDITDGRR